MRASRAASTACVSPRRKASALMHVLRVVLRRHQVHAGPRAALDLVEQAGPGAVGEHGVFAGAQPEHLLQQLDRFLHGPGARVRTEIAVLAVDGAAVVGDAGERGGRGGRSIARARLVRTRDLQVRIALVVAKQDVVARVERLDQVVFKQQRLGLGAHHGRFQPRDLADHVAYARSAVVLLEVAGDALFQVARLAHVEHAVVGVEIAVDARQRRQRGDLRQQLIGMDLGHTSAIVATVAPQSSTSLNSPPHALGHLLQGHRQPRRYRRVLAPVGPARRARGACAPLGGRCFGAGLDGSARPSASAGVGLGGFGRHRARRRRDRGLRLRPHAALPGCHRREKTGAGPAAGMDQPGVPDGRILCAALPWPALTRALGPGGGPDQAFLLPRLHAAHRRIAARARPRAAPSGIRPHRLAA